MWGGEEGEGEGIREAEDVAARDGRRGGAGVVGLEADVARRLWVDDEHAGREERRVECDGTGTMAISMGGASSGDGHGEGGYMCKMKGRMKGRMSKGECDQVGYTIMSYTGAGAHRAWLIEQGGCGE